MIEAIDSVSAQVALTQQLQLIEKQISDLLAEKDTLERLLIKIRRNDLTIKDVTRKNSVERILMETIILERLKLVKKPISSRQLLKYAREANVDLKDSTFRSYLTRMAERGLIAKGYAHGYWGLPKARSQQDT